MPVIRDPQSAIRDTTSKERACWCRVVEWAFSINRRLYGWIGGRVEVKRDFRTKSNCARRRCETDGSPQELLVCCLVLFSGSRSKVVGGQSKSRERGVPTPDLLLSWMCVLPLATSVRTCERADRTMTSSVYRLQ